MRGTYWKRVASGIVLTLVGLALLPARALAADSPAVQEARQRVESKQYTEALKVISQALTNSQPTDPSGDRYELLLLRGECLIQINQRPAAAAAFDMAFKSAPDSRAAAVARANALLVRAAPTGKYVPKTPGQQT